MGVKKGGGGGVTGVSFSSIKFHYLTYVGLIKFEPKQNDAVVFSQSKSIH